MDGADMPRPGVENDTTLTPLWLIEMLGEFDFDPCGYPGHATAKHVNLWPSDGLTIDWHGKVWCNPPYSAPGPFLQRLAQHGNGIALVLASTDTGWFQEAYSSADWLFFPKGRPTFYRKDMTPVKLMRASALIGWGAAADALRDLALPGFACRGGALSADVKVLLS